MRNGGRGGRCQGRGGRWGAGWGLWGGGYLWGKVCVLEMKFVFFTLGIEVG